MENLLSCCGCMQRFVSSEKVEVVFYNNLIELRREKIAIAVQLLNLV